MARSRKKTRFAGEYRKPAKNQVDAQTARARWRLIQTIERLCPKFVERLRDELYAKYLRLSRHNPDYWEVGMTLETWQTVSDPDGKLLPHLRRWARSFNINEDWVLHGALQTMYYWKSDRKLRRELSLHGFFPVGVRSPLEHRERVLRFEYLPWDPQLEEWTGYRDGVLRRLEKVLSKQGKRRRKVIERRGAVRADVLVSDKPFEWLVLKKCCNMSLAEICETPGSAKHTATISKGIKKAAELACTSVPGRARKLKST